MILINCINFQLETPSNPLPPIQQMCMSGGDANWTLPLFSQQRDFGVGQVSNWDIPQETVAPSFIFFSSTNWTFCFFCTSKAKWYPCQWVIYGQLGCNDLVAILAVSCISYFLLIISLKQCYNPVCSWHWRDKSWWICGLLTSHICNVITLRG